MESRKKVNWRYCRENADMARIWQQSGLVNCRIGSEAPATIPPTPPASLAVHAHSTSSGHAQQGVLHAVDGVDQIGKAAGADIVYLQMLTDGARARHFFVAVLGECLQLAAGALNLRLACYRARPLMPSACSTASKSAR